MATASRVQFNAELEDGVVRVRIRTEGSDGSVIHLEHGRDIEHRPNLVDLDPPRSRVPPRPRLQRRQATDQETWFWQTGR